MPILLSKMTILLILRNTVRSILDERIVAFFIHKLDLKETNKKTNKIIYIHDLIIISTFPQTCTLILNDICRSNVQFFRHLL